VDKTEDGEFTFQVAELDVYLVEGIPVQANNPMVLALMSDAIKRQVTMKMTQMQVTSGGATCATAK
jgi:hypothetical protein